MGNTLKLSVIGLGLFISGCQATKNSVAHQVIENLSGQEYQKGAYCQQLKQQCQVGSYQEWTSEWGYRQCTCDGPQNGQSPIHSEQ